MPHSTTVASPRTIAVDLTPVLPGGQNGGAWIFVRELLLQLAEIAPRPRFMELIQQMTEAELDHLSQTNS